LLKFKKSSSEREKFIDRNIDKLNTLIKRKQIDSKDTENAGYAAKDLTKILKRAETSDFSS
jgi:hypothetical protein